MSALEDRDALSLSPVPGSTDLPADMVAPSSAHSVTPDGSLALVNAVDDHNSATPHKSHHPDQHWDGRRVTLSSWYAEFETTLSYFSPTLYEFAVNGMVYDRTTAIIFTPGQAAQLSRQGLGLVSKHVTA